MKKTIQHSNHDELQNVGGFSQNNNNNDIRDWLVQLLICGWIIFLDQSGLGNTTPFYGTHLLRAFVSDNQNIVLCIQTGCNRSSGMFA